MNCRLFRRLFCVQEILYHTHLPYIVIGIDEFNDLKMSCNNNDAENFTVRIAQKARAAGIHLIIGTQRPSVDVITGKL